MKSCSSQCLKNVQIPFLLLLLYHIKEYFLDAESKGPDYEVHGNLANSETRR